MPTDLIKSFKLQSLGFGIETEIMANLVSNNIQFQEINIRYNRRTRKQGKKLRIFDGWSILFTMLKFKVENKIAGRTGYLSLILLLLFSRPGL